MKILFICHGNICRSTMAEFVMKKMVADAGLDWEIASAATSREEIGNDIHYGTKTILCRKEIPFTARKARQIADSDYRHYDLLIGMDKHNLINMRRFYPSDPDQKLRLLLDRDIADPWYTGDFETTFSDVWEGCSRLLQELK